jgi:hypothetical protein
LLKLTKNADFGSGFVQKVRRASPVRDEMFIAYGLKINSSSVRSVMFIAYGMMNTSSSVRSDISYIPLLTELELFNINAINIARLRR